MMHTHLVPEAIFPGEPMRCAFCGAVLATAEFDGLRIYRGQLEVLVGGAEHATFVCYRPGCRRINRFAIRPSFGLGARRAPVDSNADVATLMSHSDLAHRI